MRARLVATALAAFAAGFLARGLFIDEGAPPTPADAPPQRAPAATAPSATSRAPRRVDRAADEASSPSASGSESEPDDVAAAPSHVETPPAAATPAAATSLIVRGRCIDDAGAPVPNVRVHLPDRNVADATDDDGRFELTGVPLRAEAVNVFPEGRGYAARRVVMRAPRDGVVDLGDVALRRGGSIRGRFVDLAGKPVAGAPVWLDSEEVGWLVVARTTTDADGRFALENVGEGTHVVSGRSPACTFDGGAQDAGVQGVTAGRADVLLAVRSAHWVRLQYVDERGRHVGLFRGRMSWTALDDPSDSDTFQWEGGGWTHGRVPVRVGVVYEVRYECPGWLPVVQRVEGGEEYERRVDVVFRPAPK